MQVAELHAEPRKRIWRADDSNFEQHTAKDFQRLRAKYLEEAVETARRMKIEAPVIRSSLKCSHGATAIGTDDVEFRALAEPPDVALAQFGGLCRQAVSNLTLPFQSLLNNGCLLGKKAGGSRGIAIMCFFYGGRMKVMSPKIREWDLNEGHRYDSALAGSSSLRVAVIRVIKIENATAMGMRIGHLLWGM